MLRDTLSSLRIAVGYALASGDLTAIELTIVDNGDDDGLLELVCEEGWDEVRFETGHGNVGFGQGHNLAIAHGMGDLHLILNPDVYLLPQSLALALRFMNEQCECVLLSPAMKGGRRGSYYLCKRPPSVLDLFLRGFAPAWMRWLFRERMAHYEMESEGDEPILWDPPIVSGCFMLLRAEVLRQLGGFDPRYFLYFEDFDLSMRARKFGRLAAVGEVRIAHFGGGAARKGWKHIQMFCRSARVFFDLHGWKWI